MGSTGIDKIKINIIRKSSAYSAQEKLDFMIEQLKNNGIEFFEDLEEKIQDEIASHFSESYEADDIAFDLYFKQYLAAIFKSENDDQLNINRVKLCQMVEGAFKRACERYVNDQLGRG